MKLNLEALPTLGEVITVKFKTATFNAKVLDARIRYGNVDALVTPVSGGGQFWTVYTKPVVIQPPATPEAYYEPSADDRAGELVDAEIDEANASIIE